MRRLAGLLVAVLAAASTTLLGAVPSASAAPVSSCTTTTGTIVAVDFSHWGGPVVRGCGVNQPTGYALMHEGGFSTVGDSHDGPAFICRIGNAAFHGAVQYPTVSDEPCILTPPASAYWSYWLASAGQNTWTYSSLGAMSEVPKPGQVELWSFGGTNIAGNSGSGLPRVTPAEVRATNVAGGGGSGGSGGSTGGTGSGSGGSTGGSGGSTGGSGGTSGGSSGTSGSAGGGTSAGSSGGSAGSGTPAGSGTGTRAAGSPATSPTTHAASSGGGSVKPSASTRPQHQVRSSASASASAAAAASGGAGGGPKVIDAAPASSTRGLSTGSAVPLTIAVVVIVGLAGAAGWTVRRRRQ